MVTRNERAATSRMNVELTAMLRGLRQESRAPRMMAMGLNRAMAALGAEGAAVIRALPDAVLEEPEVLHRAGIIGPPGAMASTLLWQAEIGVPAFSHEPNGRPIFVAVCRHTGSEKLGLVLWRRRGARAWTSEDGTLADAMAGIVWLLMEREAGRRDLAGASRTDPLTALLNQRSFIAEATRHIVRLDRDNQPGTLMLAEVDNLASVQEMLGPEGGDHVLRRAAVLLQSAVRPSDLVGRMGEAEFGIWLSGADHLTAAERAENLCLEAPGKIVEPGHSAVLDVSFSIGIATRQAGESFTDLARRAGHAMREVKLAGGGYWRVSLSHAG
jgi:diguanylate cyclase (GGDEF)-like protein